MDMNADYQKEFPGVANFDAESALNMVSDHRVAFIDGRDPNEQAVSMMPGTVANGT